MIRFFVTKVQSGEVRVFETPNEVGVYMLGRDFREYVILKMKITTIPVKILDPEHHKIVKACNDA